MFFLLRIFRFAISPSARQLGHLSMQQGIVFVPDVSLKVVVLVFTAPLGAGAHGLREKASPV